MDDLSNLTDEQVEARAQASRAEAERRKILRETPAQVDQLVQQYQGALGRAGGGDWVEPENLMCSYPYGAVVTHGEQLHESLKHLNMTEPGTDPEAWSPVQDGETE